MPEGYDPDYKKWNLAALYISVTGPATTSASTPKKPTLREAAHIAGPILWFMIGHIVTQTLTMVADREK